MGQQIQCRLFHAPLTEVNIVTFLLLTHIPVLHRLVKRILSAMTSCSLDSVLIGLEATSVYGDNLVYFLREDAALARFNSKIHVLNLKQVSKFKEAYNDLPKNDFIDSFVIADCPLDTFHRRA